MRLRDSSKMKKKIMTYLIVVVIIISSIFAGCIENNSSPLNTSSQSTPVLTPKSESTEHQITAKPIMRFTVKKGDDRIVTVTCPDGDTIIHNYTSGNEYICPKSKTVVKAQTHIAIIKEGIVLVPLSSLIRDPSPLGLYFSSTGKFHTKPVIGTDRPQRMEGTRIMTYYLEKDNVSMVWSEESSNIINVSGHVRKLSSEPFREDAMYVTYYDDGPRYKSIFEQSYRYRSYITFVPLKDFVQPFGYEVKQTGDIVTVFSN